MRRSSLWQKNVALNIVLGVLLLIMFLNLLFIGLFVDKILEELFPGGDHIVIVNGIIIYYLAIEFFIRFFIQALPTLNIETYLHLPIRKSSIVHYVASKSIFVIGNYISWIVLFPFAFKVIGPAYNAGMAWIWVLTLILLVFSNNFFATYIKRQLIGKSYIVGFIGLVFISLIMLDYFGVISLSALSSSAFGQLLAHPFFVIVPLLILIFTYGLNYFFLKSKLYPEEINIKRKEKVDALSNIKYLKTIGLTGLLISLDMRLIWRHKRTRSILFMAPIFLAYGLIFYPQTEYKGAYGLLIFVGIFMTGGMMLNYTNYCFGYESNYFDNILANYKEFERYLYGKYIFAVSIASVCYILTIPYVFFGTDILLINTMTFLYNIGFLSFVLFYFSTYSKKRMDLSKGAAFNYQGLGASHWLSMLPAFLLPVFIFLPFKLMGMPKAGLLFIGALGVAGLLFHKYLLGLILKQFNKKKYDMAEGFRQ